MAGGPSPSGTSPAGAINSSFLHGSLSSSASSPPQSFPSSQSLTADAFPGVAGGLSHAYRLSPIGERKATEKNNTSLVGFGKLEHSISNPDSDMGATIFIRKLPRSTGPEALRSMLIFAKDLMDVDFINPDIPEDQGFLSAIAHFKTLGGAHEAKERLNGKANAANDANMIVEVFQDGAVGMNSLRRNTSEGPLRHNSSSASSMSSSSHANRQSSRYNNTFQSLEKMSPPNATDPFPKSEGNSHIQNLFSPKSPIGNSFVSSKSMINEDDGNDETGKLLANPVEYAKNGESNHAAAQRRQTNPSIAPLARFAGLSLSTVNGNSMTSPPMSSFTSPRQNMQSPTSAISPNTMIPGHGPNASYQLTPQHYQRHNYPPVNPADQNPPCNTLYVGNLPIDTSEDELKAMFSKQRGYKRLCFRTKQNGPMCFVEFEDVSFATKALNELYGHPLHNSVKGGIRLSFSKNPLGVRTGQSAGMGVTSPLTPQSGFPGMPNGMGNPPGFSTATGPPPGLSAPPGLPGPLNMNGGSSFGNFGNNAYPPPMRTHSVGGPMAASVAGNTLPGMGGEYAYMMGR
ncbi:hypothetical protein K402DRAFT_328024 [Aulographum hederae CBS 113979]|uniref:RRM domain-containing protein n=1 Tax=Aulographum hederae CBS 113979 TaxID=1176131 RepID=A0A6G1H6Q3_9PEZI|nr:hypothetical protein K402DRAFT_328024 [Aulographum hederae CBS 113979]